MPDATIQIRRQESVGTFVTAEPTSAATIDVPALAEYAAGLPDVVVAASTSICARTPAGVDRQDIREHNLPGLWWRHARR